MNCLQMKWIIASFAGLSISLAQRKVLKPFVRTQKIFSIICLASVLASAFSVAAQTQRPVNTGSQGGAYKPKVQTSGGKQGNAPKSKVPVVSGGAVCKGGWSGVVNYSQTLDDEGKKNRETARSVSKQEWSHDLKYTGTMIVDGSDPQQTVASGEVSFTEIRRQREVENEISQCGAWKPEHWFTWEHQQNDTETGTVKAAAQSFLLYVDEARGTYKLSFTFPQAPGKFVREDRTTRSGHCQEKNNEPIINDYNKTTVIRGEGGSIENQKINPNEPDVLQGKVTIDNNNYSDPNNIKTPITTISWKLLRCPPPLVITDVKFYHLRYPSPSTWEEILDDDYTIDGNDVKIAATIVNLSGARKSATVNFKELKENVDLPQGQVAADFEPHESRTVEYVWDTSGFAWKEAQPRNLSEIFRQIEVKIPQDRKVEEIEVHPKPVVLVPGLWSKPEMFGKFAALFNKNKLDPWATALAPIYIKQTAASNAKVIDKTVRDLQEKENAWHVDLVAHSTGGLMARAYIDSLMPRQYDNRPAATHLIMLGTPNMGTPCADGADGVISKILNSESDAFSELSHENMRVFNETFTRRNGTKFAAMVGNSVSPTCQLNEAGDGIVPYISARWLVRDYVLTNERHENLIDEVPFAQVRKWLAVPPKGDHAPDNRQASNVNSSGDNLHFLTEENFGKSSNYGAMFRPTNFTENLNTNDETEPSFATGVRLAANESKEIEIPVANDSRFSLILYAAAPHVSAILFDDEDELIGKNLFGTPDAAEIFRTMTIKNVCHDSY